MSHYFCLFWRNVAAQLFAAGYEQLSVDFGNDVFDSPGRQVQLRRNLEFIAPLLLAA